MFAVIRKSALFIMLLFSPLNLQAGAVIVSPDVDTASVSRQLLLSVFSMRLNYWQDGVPVEVYVFADDDPAHLSFTKRYLRVFPYQLRAVWDRAVFTGSGDAPHQVFSAEEMLQKISAGKGAIGYVDGDLKGTENVRVVYEY
ncbi:hypothetical protein [Aliamphritea hakodatensis]|uniref:hypothetical protein n=1 Tax=Aliamphritea hakodatensis TaxID=2895352 RepID=UPI0022FD8C77|nr:hypothetical protein [Aliamphritea hakodatensis]